jgi:hypothetical protein
MHHSHRIEITHMETYIDGSGLVAVISVDGVIFSGQYLGAIRINYPQPRRGSGLSTARFNALKAAATKSFRQVVDGMGDEFFRRNHEMYAENVVA